jgi:hypothetical protein
MPLSVRDMAAQLGVSKSQVARDKLAGMPMSDAAAARAWRDENHDVSRTVEGRIDRPGLSRDTSATADGGLATTAGAGGAGAPPASSADAAPDDAPGDQASAEYRQDRARNERIRADLAQLELDKAKGLLIDAAEAARMAYTSFRSLRDQAFNLAARLAPQLAIETDVLRIEQLIDAELSTVFGQFDEARLLREPEDDDDAD